MKYFKKIFVVAFSCLVLSLALSCTIDPALSNNGISTVDLQILNYSAADRTDKITIGIGHIDAVSTLFQPETSIEFFERNSPNPVNITIPPGVYDLAWKLYQNGDWQSEWSYNDSCRNHQFVSGQNYQITYYNTTGLAVDANFVLQ